ncbi:hypothetical protein JG688_00006260 [Phytophthora aleatoria]|uniref:Uncharacterized protein n=1 Tax=Phytophthora aleatoria TaxID=2496075 RepID=A0A8J5M900_9STRA|nr:hypothetical protein JG688_00006260 [Phytophthora aleatoria]
MDAEAFDALYNMCRPHIRSSLQHPREVLAAVALNQIGTAATCRGQEVFFGLA